MKKPPCTSPPAPAWNREPSASSMPACSATPRQATHRSSGRPTPWPGQDANCVASGAMWPSSRPATGWRWRVSPAAGSPASGISRPTPTGSWPWASATLGSSRGRPRRRPRSSY